MPFQDQEIDEEFELLVLASDGLWDVVPNEVKILYIFHLVALSPFFANNKCKQMGEMI